MTMRRISILRLRPDCDILNHRSRSFAKRNGRILNYTYASHKLSIILEEGLLRVNKARPPWGLSTSFCFTRRTETTRDRKISLIDCVSNVAIVATNCIS